MNKTKAKTKSEKSRGRWIDLFRLVLVVSGVAVLLMLIFIFPGIMDEALNQHPGFKSGVVLFAILICTAALFFFGILFSTEKICFEIKRDNSFSMENVRNLRMISILALVDTSIFVVLASINLNIIMAHPAVMLLFLVLIFAFTVVFALASILTKVLHKAIEIKTEQDFTI